MVMKVSTSMFFDKASKQLGSIQGSLAKTQEQLSTGKQINKPSDEPDKASLITRLDSELARQKSYQGNLKAVNIRLQAEETALKNTSNVMYRFKELAVQAGNDTLSPADRRTLSLEMTQLKEQILSLASAIWPRRQGAGGLPRRPKPHGGPCGRQPSYELEYSWVRRLCAFGACG